MDARPPGCAASYQGLREDKAAEEVGGRRVRQHRPVPTEIAGRVPGATAQNLDKPF